MFCLLWPILAIPFKLVVGVERGALNCDDLAEIRMARRTETERKRKQAVIDCTSLHLPEYHTVEKKTPP